MPPHGGFRLGAIAGADGVDDGIVLMHRFFRDLAAETGADLLVPSGAGALVRILTKRID